MNLSRLFSTKERIAILKEILIFNELKPSVIARKLKISKALVSKYFKILHEEKALENESLRDFLAKIELKKFDFGKYHVKAAGIHGKKLWVKTEYDENLPELVQDLMKSFPAYELIFLSKEKLAKLKEKEPSLYYAMGEKC